MLHLPLLSTFKQALRLGCVWMALCGPMAMAQPVVGQTYKDFLPMGSGASVPLPEGVWKSTHNDGMSRATEVWEIHVLKNQTLDA